MLNKITPEAAGIPSEKIVDMLNAFKRKNYAMHSVLIAHRGNVCFEEYWKPYDKDSLHRIYSASKSFVSIAIGFLCDEGKISLNDKVLKYFPEYKDSACDYLKEQTICDMLKMSTSSLDRHWMGLGVKKRIEYYFTREQNRPSGTIYNYDSTGTYIMAVVVEKVSGKNFVEYLREKLFRKIGVSEELCCLKTPEGYPWADSGIRCTTEDFYRVAQFVCNGGSWNGEQLLSCEFVKSATKKQAFNANDGYGGYNKYGYGYQFWITEQNGFSFNGMANQFAICLPEKDFVFICTADNQFNPTSAEIIYENVFEKIVNNLSDEALPDNPAAYNELKTICHDLKIPCVIGETQSDFQTDVNGIVYQLNENEMNIESFQLKFFDNNEGCFEFTNNEGTHRLPFGIGKNVFCKFPKKSMPDEIGGEVLEGFSHQCAVSAAWVEEKKLFIKVQIIDKYLANLNITIGFNKNMVGLQMVANAEFFLEEYCGFAGGKIKKDYC